MGNSANRGLNKLKNKLTSSSQSHPQQPAIGQPFPCPNCSKLFPSNTISIQIQKHIVECYKKKQKEEKQKISEQLVPSKNDKVILNYDIQEYYYVKEPIDDSFTQFKWQKAPIKLINNHVFNMAPQQVQSLSFQQKSAWFRFNLQKMRISWMKGADFMNIEKSNVLMSSLIESKKVNMYKQVKIQFIGDKVNDAGGLLREWMHLVINQMFDQSTGIFKLCNTDDTMYKLKWDEDIDQQFSRQLLILYGVILGKAIFEKIPINSYLDRTILRQLASKNNNIQFYDIFGFDKQLYQNWKFLLENQIDEMGLEAYFTITKQNSENATLEIVQLLQDGKNIMVTDENKKMYVSLCIQTICKQKVSRSVDYIRKGLQRVIPEQLLRVFQPFELQMLLYGVPYIDVKDWKINTDYKGQYNINHEVIRWFWEVMQAYNQQQLARLLKFSTGSTRTPIHGFKKLQSNRGNFSKFLIQSAKFLKQNPFPKGHTCFNRLELPRYQSKDQLRLYLNSIANNNLDGIFGLD